MGGGTEPAGWVVVGLIVLLAAAFAAAAAGGLLEMAHRALARGRRKD
jgi:hypothetical protein